MSASRASALSRGLALLLVLGLAGAALAQQEPLVETQPLAPVAPAETPVPEGTSPDNAPPVAGEGPQSLLPPAAQDATGPEVLATVPAQAAAAGEGLGLLSEDDGGFGPALWEGMDRTELEELLPQLPVGTSSPTLFALTRRLLLSDAPLPAPSAPTGETNAAIDLLDVRLERLWALGVMEELERLLAILPPERLPDVRKRLTVELLLTEGNETAACELVRLGDPTGGSDLFWLKALTYCQFRAGETAAAELGLALLRDLGREQDLLFVRLLSAALGLAPLQADEALPAGQLRSLELALLASLPTLPLPEGLLATGAARARMQLALDDSVPLNARAAATEWAVSSRRLSSEHLATLYDSFEFAPTTLDDALNAGYRLPGVEARALYFQALQKPGGPQQELLTAELALDSAEADGVYVGMAEVVLPELAADPDDSGLAWLAAMLGRANYVLGRYEAATAWLLLAKREAPVSAQAAAASLRLWPYARLAGTTRFANEAGVDGWRYAQGDPASEEVAEQAAFLEVLFEALGEADAAVAWAEPAEEELAREKTAAPDAAVLVALEEASRAGRLGETVLRVLVLLGEGEPAEAQPQALGAALSALMQVGLPLEARALAIEAALGKGI
jgi:hypothetical protein